VDTFSGKSHLFWKFEKGAGVFLPCLATRPVTSLGHQEGRRVFREGPKFFELCPLFSNYIQHVFPGGTKNFLGGLRPPWLRACWYVAYRYNHRSYVIRLKTDNWQYAAQFITEN